MNYKPFLLAGVLAVVIYIAAVVIGGALRPGYSHIANFVSELIGAGAPNKGLLNPLFFLYNLLTGAFGLGMLIFVGARSTSGQATLGRIGAIVLLAEAVFGLVTVFFPQDVRGTPATFTGTTHIVLAGLSSLTTMGAILLVGLWLLRTRSLAGYGWYSVVSLCIVFVSGGLTAYSTAANTPTAGLLERITIGGFLQWMLVLGLQLSSL